MSTKAKDRMFGCGTAMITPFLRGGDVDQKALRALVAWQIEQGIHFLVPCGSTGEAATLTPAEHALVVEIVVEEARGRVPVVAGAGSNDTQKAVALSKAMKKAGATHLLHVSPMYNKPPQRGIIAHFKTIAEATDLPVIVYNVPGRTGSNIETKTALALAEIPNIVGIKEASGNLGQISDILRDRPPHFSVLSGDDSLTMAVMAHGGDGIISVVSNATPRLMAQLVERCRDGDFAGARELHEQLLPWMHAAFVESNPLPVKAALALMARSENVLRLPLVPLSEVYLNVVRDALVTAGALAPLRRSGR
jgi:4-hydroxy-tetrahydrodipicolinate synthase